MTNPFASEEVPCPSCGKTSEPVIRQKVAPPILTFQCPCGHRYVMRGGVHHEDLILPAWRRPLVVTKEKIRQLVTTHLYEIFESLNEHGVFGPGIVSCQTDGEYEGLDAIVDVTMRRKPMTEEEPLD